MMASWKINYMEHAATGSSKQLCLLSTFSQFRRTGTIGKDLWISYRWGNLKLVTTVVCNMLQKKKKKDFSLHCWSNAFIVIKWINNKNYNIRLFSSLCIQNLTCVCVCVTTCQKLVSIISFDCQQKGILPLLAPEWQRMHPARHNMQASTSLQ